MTIPTMRWSDVPKLSSNKKSQIASQATGKYNIDMRILMEHAARNVTELMLELVPEGPLLVVAGRGNNGGVGLATARLLASKNRSVWVVPTHEAGNYSGIPKEQLASLDIYNVRLKSSLPKMKFAGAIDAAVGAGLEGPPRGRTLDTITVLNNMENCNILSVDVPTGMMIDDGNIPGIAVNASATISFVYPNQGIEPNSAAGELYVGSLNLPAKLFKDIDLAPPSFPTWLTKLE